MHFTTVKLQLQKDAGTCYLDFVNFIDQSCYIKRENENKNTTCFYLCCVCHPLAPRKRKITRILCKKTAINLSHFFSKQQNVNILG